MQPIDPQALSSVHGGFAALLGPLLQAAPGILQGVSGIIAASKSGGSSPPAAGSAAPQAPAPAAPTQAAPATSQACCCCAPMTTAPMASMSQMVQIG